MFESRSEDLYAQYQNPELWECLIVKVVHRIIRIRFKQIVETKKNGSVKFYSNKKNNLSGLDLINNLEADVLIETTASNYKDAEPGMTHITTAMKHGMHVISVNKGPLALAFPSLMELATYNQVLLRFSGTVGGGTPILDYAKNSLRGEESHHLLEFLMEQQIVLTNMERNSYDAALKDAKQKGYVEADESLDLDGLDAAAKLVILANWIMDMKVTLPDVNRTGIRVNLKTSKKQPRIIVL